MTDRTFFKLTFAIPASEQEKWIAVLSHAGCYGFEEEDDHLHAFIEPADFDEDEFRRSVEAWLPGEKVNWKFENIEEEDWNLEWEKNYEGMTIGDFCQIIPSFKKPDPGIRHTVSIDPRMAFGTGHHQTTRLMIRQMEKLDLRGQKVLDMGCGTGILAILAEKMGAGHILAVDFDSWAVQNTMENCQINACTRVKVLPGDTAPTMEGEFGIIFANINRKVLLTESVQLEAALAKGGKLILSGIYLTDIPVITEKYAASGLHPVAQLTEDEWVSLVLMRKGE